jgi:dipeptidyl aminopeptidase/acylaminoacyl peptidase
VRKHKKQVAKIASLVLLGMVGLALAGCAAGPGMGGGPVEPTITAILLPTRTPTEAVAMLPTTLLTATPTETPRSTATPVLETATATPVEPTATPTATALPPTATEARTASATVPATAVQKPTKAQPRPTATPEFSGKLVFQTTIGGEFYTINADGSNLQRITDGVDPIWSPDGKQIAFTRWRDPRGVWVVDANGSNERRVFDWDEARWPSWSPDGSQILFSRQHGGRTEDRERCFFGFCFDVPAKPHWRLGQVDLAQGGDGAFREPPSPLISLAPDWSPRGEQVVFSGEHGLLIQTVDGEISYPVTNDSRDIGAVWSPDGQRLAFTRRQHDHWEVYVVDADGRNLSRLTDTPERPDRQPGNSAAPAWSPDGKFLAFMTDRTGTWEIWVMRAGGRQQKAMFGSALSQLPLEYGSVGERALSWTR